MRGAGWVVGRCGLASVGFEGGRRQEALDAWDSSIATLEGRPGLQAELRALRASWLTRQGDADGPLADLLAVAATVPGEPSELDALGRARRTVRSVVDRLPPQTRATLPPWATVPISDEIATLASEWASVAGTRDEAGFLRARSTQLQNPEIAEGIAVLGQVTSMGVEAAITALGDANHLVLTLREWIATPTWSESRALLVSLIVATPVTAAATGNVGCDASLQTSVCSSASTGVRPIQLDRRSAPKTTNVGRRIATASVIYKVSY
jgi:hypothetical protein